MKTHTPLLFSIILDPGKVHLLWSAPDPKKEIAVKVKIVCKFYINTLVFNWKQRTPDQLETVPIFIKSFFLYPQIVRSFSVAKLPYNNDCLSVSPQEMVWVKLSLSLYLSISISSFTSFSFFPRLCLSISLSLSLFLCFSTSPSLSLSLFLSNFKFK